MSYLKHTIRGFSWMLALRGITRFVAFIRIGILARLLSPLQFGLFGIAGLVLAFLEIITETGINVFLIQKEGDIKDYIDTSWVVSIVRGIIIAFLIALSSPLVSHFFKSPDALKLILLISLVPLIKGFINPSAVILQKELKFAKEFWFRFSIFTFDSSVAILTGFIIKSAVCIVFGLIAGAILELILSFVFISPRPKLKLETVKFKEVVNKGKWVTFYGFFNYLFENLDDILVGKVLGSVSLGIYQVAYRISSLPITEVSDVVMKVTFPVYSKISSEKERLKNAFVKSTFVSIFMILPFGVFVYIFAKDLTLILLGQGWSEAVPIIKILAFFGIARAINQPFYSLFLSVKKQKFVTYSTLLNILIMIFFISFLLPRYGLLGVSYSVLISSIATIPVSLIFIKRIFKYEFAKG